MSALRLHHVATNASFDGWWFNQPPSGFKGIYSNDNDENYFAKIGCVGLGLGLGLTPMRTGLFRAGAEQHHGNRAHEDGEVEPDGPVVNVLQVQADPVAEVGDFVAPADLPEAGEAGLDA